MGLFPKDRNLSEPPDQVELEVRGPTGEVTTLSADADTEVVAAIR